LSCFGWGCKICATPDITANPEPGGTVCLIDGLHVSLPQGFAAIWTAERALTGGIAPGWGHEPQIFSVFRDMGMALAD
jgi:hypothetical protein